jgi:hypothetical protein
MTRLVTSVTTSLRYPHVRNTRSPSFHSSQDGLLATGIADRHQYQRTQLVMPLSHSMGRFSNRSVSLRLLSWKVRDFGMKMYFFPSTNHSCSAALFVKCIMSKSSRGLL